MYGFICENCKKGRVKATKVEGYETKVEGIPFRVSHAEIGICDTCSAKYFNAREVRRWREEFYRTQSSRGGFLRPSEIRSTRKLLGLSIADFARLIGCSRQGLYNLESEERVAPQSRMADLLIRIVRESYEKGAVDAIAILQGIAIQTGLEIQPCCRAIPLNLPPQSAIPRNYGAQTTLSDCRFDDLFPARTMPIAFSPRLRRQVA